MRCEHRTAEHRARSKGRGRTVDERKLPAHKPGNPDCERTEQTGRGPEGRVPKGRDAAGARNHWFDCVIGCAAAASMQGVERIGAAVQPQGRRERLKLSELRARRRSSGLKAERGGLQ